MGVAGIDRLRSPTGPPLTLAARSASSTIATVVSTAEITPPVERGSSPAPMGSLGRALVEVLAPLQTAVVLVTLVVTFALLYLSLTADTFIDVVSEVGRRVGATAGIWFFALLAGGFFALAVAIVAFVPPLLLRGADRDAMAVHSWLGAREVRRVLGRPSRAAELMGTPDAARRWLAETPRSEELRPIRFEALLLVGRFDEARTEAEALPDGTPFESYRRSEAIAIVDDQVGLPFDEAALRAAIAAIPPGIDRTEASVSLAVTLARRALPHGDWRRPLLDVRGLLPESDAVLLTRDFGLTIFDILARRVVLPFIVLLFVLALAMTVLPALLD
jgi:hypothetical protein